jgi:flagellar biosynthetic protein FliQ
LDGDAALSLLDGMLWNGFLIAGPVLVVALAVGIAVSVLQVATQLQEVTLSYVPKLLACAAVLVLLGPWLLGRLTGYAAETIARIPSLG